LGLGGLDGTSHRTLIAELDDDLQANPAGAVVDVAARWNDLFWGRYSTQFATQLTSGQALEAKGAQRTPAERAELDRLVRETYCGFCLGGCRMPNRGLHAFVLEFDPRFGKRPPQPLSHNTAYFFGIFNPIMRTIKGVDDGLVADILASGKWSGTETELRSLASRYALANPGALPLRDAIDFVHSSMYATIKALKFSQMSQVCGGPIEIAIISSDRRFRWVRHKTMDEAVSLQEARHGRP